MPDPISWAHSGPYLLAAVLGGYFLGAIPFGLVLARLAGLGDIRNIGHDPTEFPAWVWRNLVDEFKFNQGVPSDKARKI